MKREQTAPEPSKSSCFVSEIKISGETHRQNFCSNSFALAGSRPAYFMLCLKLTVVQIYLQGRKKFYAFNRLGVLEG